MEPIENEQLEERIHSMYDGIMTFDHTTLFECYKSLFTKIFNVYGINKTQYAVKSEPASRRVRDGCPRARDASDEPQAFGLALGWSRVGSGP